MSAVEDTTSINSSNPDAVRADQVAAIRASGWGTRFRLVQPRNLAFWVYLALVVPGILMIVRYLGSATAVYGQAITAAIVLFAIYGASFWWFTQRIDRYAHQSRDVIVVAFLWGGFGALAMASNANTPILSLWGKAFGAAWSSDWGAGLTAPFIEETAKGIGLLLVIALAGRAVATAFDGFILGAFIGLGFQIVEDITYAVGAAGQSFGADPGANELQTIALRMLVGVGAHIAYSAIFCTGLVYLLGRLAQPRRVVPGIGLILTAVVLHGIWDNLGGIAGSAALLVIAGWVLMTAITVAIVITIFTVTVRPERDFMRQVLAPEVAAGVITQEEADTLAGGRQARAAYRRASRHKAGDKRQRQLILQAAHDLADELARAGGARTTRAEFARSEVRRIRGPRQATDPSSASTPVRQTTPPSTPSIDGTSEV